MIHSQHEGLAVLFKEIIHSAFHNSFPFVLVFLKSFLIGRPVYLAVCTLVAAKIKVGSLLKCEFAFGGREEAAGFLIEPEGISAYCPVHSRKVYGLLN